MADDAREFEKHVDLAQVAATLDKPVHHVHHPCRAFTTGRTLSTRLVLVELAKIS